ncbi:helix-turn-helix domain-containing protein [Spirosoma utsteinense]|uniref:AraC-like DNA-binding protein n=2 Tax=Spirosoma utsteinense TaxID=2585773 RepID=A0ABR6W920_9BACT|nr:helix-turn-helix domain-containing protein [Spirosoma utsteinense]MBC3787321.1 AraC-like DNA-binding protein [Spirosoma utsteinense]MBC3793007.1 AraC-like DNA-binding protein [Spirosoma utsteinense]
MMKTRPHRRAVEAQPITMVYDMPSVLPPGTTPVSRLYYEDWNIKVVDREKTGCDNYLTPNRRDFYKIMFMTSGTGMKTMGKENYFIDERTILFLHPNEIVCWRNASPTVGGGIFCMFKKRYLDQHPSLKLIIDRYKFFTEKKILRLSEESAKMIHSLLTQMKAEAASGDPLAEEAMQAYVQLILVESLKGTEYAPVGEISNDYSHVYDFFTLLEKETNLANIDNPIRIRTAREYAEKLNLNPNYLNGLVKKHTGQPISTLIKNRLIEESKALLVQTAWTLQEISQIIGFADQPNFSQFFKKYVGITPNEFRRSPISPDYEG